MKAVPATERMLTATQQQDVIVLGESRQMSQGQKNGVYYLSVSS